MDTMAMSLPFSLEFYIAPLFILVCVAILLFGAFTVQVYFYWFTYESDVMPLRGFILTIWVLECTHTVICVHMIYQYLILDAGSPLKLLEIVWSVGASVLLEVIVISMTQGFYIHRIWLLSKQNVIVTLIPAALLMARVGFGLATGGLFLVYKTYPEFHSHEGALAAANASLSLGALIDLVTCGLLTFYLRQHKSQFKRTNHIVQRLTFYTINTGTLTMMISITTVIVFNLITTSLLFGGLVEVVSKLYANTLLALLNSRENMRNQVRTNASFPLAIREQSSSSKTASNGLRVDIYKDVSVHCEDGTPDDAPDSAHKSSL